MSKYYVIGDIGGTNLRLALINVESDSYELLLKENYLTKECNNFVELLNSFLTNCVDKFKVLPTDAIICAAGPKKRNIIKLANSNLIISQKEIFEKTPIHSLDLFNDFEVIPYCVPELEGKELIEIKSGDISTFNKKLFIGPGTGLGITFTEFHKKKGLISIPSEAGHNLFRAKNDFEKDLKEHIKTNYDVKKFEWETILSGDGLEKIYNFLQETKYKKEKENLSASQISLSQKTNKCSQKTFDIFIIYLARYSRELVLKEKAFSGVYLCGGILNKNSKFNKELFVKEFLNDEKNKTKLNDVPIFHINTQDAGLLGCVGYIFKL